MMAAATVLTNGGVLLKPQIVKKIVSPQGSVVKEFGREPLWEVISPRSAQTMLEWMETATLPAGTAHRVAIDGVRIAAKTGTAQVANQQTGTYSATDFVASMMGIFPTDDPRYIVYVMIQNPRGQSYYGSQVAAPVLRQVALALIDKAGIMRTGTRPAVSPVPAVSGTPRQVTIGAVMPDLTGTPKKLLLPLLLRQDLSVSISGSGFVAKQVPPPGTKIESGARITLELR
jgi:cell division protein FtsI (penicillin-binding protein 3)